MHMHKKVIEWIDHLISQPKICQKHDVLLSATRNPWSVYKVVFEGVHVQDLP